MTRFFGTNGIRGIFPKEFTLEFIHDMTLAIGTVLKGGPILIGYDGRKSSPVICKVVCCALNSIGIDCNVAGIVPTPCLEFAVKALGYSGGIMITASHNPPQYNGIKVVGIDGVEISRNDEQVIEDVYDKKDWLNNPARWGCTKKEDRCIKTYLHAVAAQVDVELIKTRNLKIVIDLGNGAQAVAAPDFCNMLNCKTILINQDIDGNFPGRGSEPTPQNLGALAKKVIENNADLGIAFDGDGDRSIFCDNFGNILTGDKSALILIKHILGKNPNSIIVTCMNSTYHTTKLAKQFNSKVILTKVGSVEVSRKMLLIDALVGFEENGGFMYGKHNQVRDGCMTLALMLELLANSTTSLNEKINELPSIFTTKTKISCPSEKIADIILSLKKEFSDADVTDGIKVVIDSENWVMIRPSGTEPIIRIYAESSTQAKLDELISKYLKKLNYMIHQK